VSVPKRVEGFQQVVIPSDLRDSMEITMAWTEITRAHYERRCARYASDLTDAEWALIAPMMPSANRIGRPRKTDLREVVNALLYLASSGGAWRLLPKDFPPFSTVQKYFYRWREEGLLRTISNSLVMAAREAEGREASPTAGVIDSQSARPRKAAEFVASTPERRSTGASVTSLSTPSA
jgi:transposase